MHQTLPLALSFPFDFGCIPGKKAVDGRSADVILITGLATFSGCALNCTIVGAVGGVDVIPLYFVAVPKTDESPATIAKPKPVGAELNEKLIDFLRHYHDVDGDYSIPKAGLKRALTKLEGFVTTTKNLKYQLVLPQFDRLGKRFAKSYYKEIEKELTDRFGGLTIYNQSLAKGYWVDEDNEVERDDIVIFEVYASDEDTRYWCGLKYRLIKQFKQKDLLISCNIVYDI